MTQPINTIRQLAYVVRDMEAALKYWVETLNVGPFFLLEHASLENQRYYDQPANTDVSIALGHSGEIQIELIVQHNNEPSVYKDFLNSNRIGVHHFGFTSGNYKETYQKYIDAGNQVAFECTYGSASIVYFDTLNTIGHYTEILENNHELNAMFLMIEKASEKWDGKNPIRKLQP